jgi:hypothetical protein
MNRRQFLSSLCVVTSVKLPFTSELKLDADAAWIASIKKALEPIFARYFEDFMLYGTAAISSTETFPYICNIPYEEYMAIPELYRSTGEF